MNLGKKSIQLFNTMDITYIKYRTLCWSNTQFTFMSYEEQPQKRTFHYTRVTPYTAGQLHTAVPHCSHSRAPIVHTAVLRENNEHGCVYLRCRAVCKLPGCVEGHPCYSDV